jgi:hypothetical protein
MNLYSINTTAYEEEDFLILTDLSEQDIVEVINPIVNAERDGYETYTNYDLASALKDRYPSASIQMIVEPHKIII